MDTVKITIDGKEIETTREKTILKAAADAGNAYVDDRLHASNNGSPYDSRLEPVR